MLFINMIPFQNAYPITNTYVAKFIIVIAAKFCRSMMHKKKIRVKSKEYFGIYFTTFGNVLSYHMQGKLVKR